MKKCSQVFINSHLYKKAVFQIILLFLTSQAQAVELKTILKNALQQDPLILEAQANEQAAISKTKASKALHYPTVTLTGNQMLEQYHQNKYSYTKNNLTPGIKGSVNIYSWGAISSQVERDKNKSRYFNQKVDETAEELGYNIGSEYLKALRAHDSLVVQMRSLERHNKFLHDIQIIVNYDQGRRSELTQAKARKMQVEHTISSLQREMLFALSNLRKYSPQTIEVDDLTDPFSQKSPNQVLTQFKRIATTEHPSYQAQKAELESVRSDLKVLQAKRYPSLNLESNVTTQDRQVFLSLSWDVFNQSSKYTVDQSAHSVVAAQSKLDQIARDIEERGRTAEIDMFQSKQKMEIAQEQIAASRDVVIANEKQFKIARKTLIDVLNAYNELAAVEMAYVTAQNDFRMAALSYLRSQAKIEEWIQNSED